MLRAESASEMWDRLAFDLEMIDLEVEFCIEELRKITDQVLRRRTP